MMLNKILSLGRIISLVVFSIPTNFAFADSCEFFLSQINEQDKGSAEIREWASAYLKDHVGSFEVDRFKEVYRALNARNAYPIDIKTTLEAAWTDKVKSKIRSRVPNLSYEAIFKFIDDLDASLSNLHEEVDYAEFTAQTRARTTLIRDEFNSDESRLDKLNNGQLQRIVQMFEQLIKSIEIFKEDRELSTQKYDFLDSAISELLFMRNAFESFYFQRIRENSSDEELLSFITTNDTKLHDFIINNITKSDNPSVDTLLEYLRFSSYAASSVFIDTFTSDHPNQKSKESAANIVVQLFEHGVELAANSTSILAYSSLLNSLARIEAASRGAISREQVNKSKKDNLEFDLEDAEEDHKKSRALKALHTTSQKYLKRLHAPTSLQWEKESSELLQTLPLQVRARVFARLSWYEETGRGSLVRIHQNIASAAAELRNRMLGE